MNHIKFYKSQIVYTVPPQCVKFLKHRSNTPKCSSIKELREQRPEKESLSNTPDANETGITDWLWSKSSSTQPPKSTLESSSEPTKSSFGTSDLPTSSTKSTQPTKYTAPSTTITSSKSTTIDETRDPKSSSTVPPSSTTQPTKPSASSTTITSSKTTTNDRTRDPKSLSTVPSSSTTQRSKSTLTTSSKPTKSTPATSKMTVPSKTALQRRNTFTTSQPTFIPTTVTEEPVSTVYEPLTIEHPTTSPSSSTSDPESSTTSKCLEWYNKINDQSYDTEEPSFPDKYSKWYHLIKENDAESEIESKISVLSPVDRWIDERTGIEFIEPVFPSEKTTPEENLNNPLVHYMATRQVSRVKNMFDGVLEHKLKTLKWLNQQISRQHRLLSEVQSTSRSSKFISNPSKIKLVKSRVAPKNVGKSTRAQRFRDEFIKKKIQRVSTDKNDGWWKNFNAKIYDAGGYQIANEEGT